jgi:hypothetical protein
MTNHRSCIFKKRQHLKFRAVGLSLALLVLSASSAEAQFRTRSPQSSGLSQSNQSVSPSDEAQKLRTLQLKVVASDRSIVGEQQRWMEMLSGVGADRVLSQTSRESQPTIEETDLGDSVHVAVTGIITNNQLLLPGGKFSIRDKARIRDHLQKLRDDGAEVALAKKMAFGLTAKQLVALHDQLSSPVVESSKGRKATDVARELVNLAGLTTVIDESAKPLIESEEVIIDELQGLSVGTALSAAVRPLGLIVEPKREQGAEIKLHLRDSREADENWPVGWPISDSPVNVSPKLFTQLDLQIRMVALKDVLDAFQGRLEIPFLYDRNGMARKGLEPAEIKVTYVKNKTNYGIAMRKVLEQSKPKMKYELRIDEVGKPFIWISPL